MLAETQKLRCMAFGIIFFFFCNMIAFSSIKSCGRQEGLAYVGVPQRALSFSATASYLSLVTCTLISSVLTQLGGCMVTLIPYLRIFGLKKNNNMSVFTEHQPVMLQSWGFWFWGTGVTLNIQSAFF